MINAAVLTHYKYQHIIYKQIEICELTRFKNERIYWKVKRIHHLDRLRFSIGLEQRLKSDLEGTQIYIRKNQLKKFGAFYVFKEDHFNYNDRFTDKEMFGFGDE